MKNVVLSMLAKISQIDATTKQLTARVEAQSLLISALVLAVSKQGGVTEVIESASKAINMVIESADTDDMLKSDAAMLLSEFQDLLTISRAVDSADSVVDPEALAGISGISPVPDAPLPDKS
ncbi:anti-adapter protein IraP [Candidatus Pantoea soli]|uniref:Anti-adapter protein IraP n=1 Tax=Candidatus Pantoea soli TaxID=3098669 RepID=A0A518XD52_9GAMM|nr:anti-adapter protein IraP [Pantoea soli]QDY42006.1 anti-adapter protein IraP [Pantoea soli]